LPFKLKENKTVKTLKWAFLWFLLLEVLTDEEIMSCYVKTVGDKRKVVALENIAVVYLKFMSSDNK
jgi:hypothetical protein